VPSRVLVVASETEEECNNRRRSTGAASHETYAGTLRDLRPGLIVETISCLGGADPMSVRDLRGFDGIFLAGSPIQMHEDRAETRAAARFMTAVFESGTPSFGSCAGLQIATVAAGGRTVPRPRGTEAAVARNITKTRAGRSHPLLRGRPPAWTAPAMHSSMVKTLPHGATRLACNADTPVEAAEIRHGDGVFWGVQYHPELTLAEIAASLRRQSADLIGEGLAADEAALEDHARRLEALDRDPARRDLAWQLGLDDQIADPRLRRTELCNFLDAIAGR